MGGYFQTVLFGLILVQPLSIAYGFTMPVPVFAVGQRLTAVMRSEEEVNLKLEGILNMRDLCTASALVSGQKLFRCGCVSNASSGDVSRLEDMGVGYLIDLRSGPELDEDEHLDGGNVYAGFGKSVYDADRGAWVVDESAQSVDGRMRYFISVMNESAVKKGIFLRLRKREKMQAFFWGLFSSMSTYAEKKMKKIFVDFLNHGGLKLLNELVIDLSPKLLVEVLKVVSKDAMPVAYYCTAGKDRTGIVTMLLLSILGASDDDIVADYILSDGAYKTLNDKKAMVASLQQADLDPDVFLTAQAPVMEHTLAYTRSKFGSMDKFLDAYGFNDEWREKLRKKAGRLSLIST